MRNSKVPTIPETALTSPILKTASNRTEIDNIKQVRSSRLILYVESISVLRGFSILLDSHIDSSFLALVGGGTLAGASFCRFIPSFYSFVDHYG